MSSDGRYFAWVKSDGAWIEPRLYPQIIVDTENAAYRENNSNKNAAMVIAARHVLDPSEYHMGIAELALKYPAPSENK